MEKKITKKTPVKKPAAAKTAGPKAKAAQEKGASKRTVAEVRTKQEEGSIAPPSSNLVSAFAMFKKRNVSTAGPTVTRLAAGACCPNRRSPKPRRSRPGRRPPVAPAVALAPSS